MIKVSVEILRNRPYFGGKDDGTQIRKLNEIKQSIYLIQFDISYGFLSLIYVVETPFSINDDWCIYYYKIDALNRKSCTKRLCLSKFSVIPYNNGLWEKHRCLLNTNGINPRKMNIEIKKYQPQYY